MADGVNAQRLLDIVRVDDKFGNGALGVDGEQEGDLARLVGLGNAERERERERRDAAPKTGNVMRRDKTAFCAMENCKNKK